MNSLLEQALSNRKTVTENAPKMVFCFGRSFNIPHVLPLAFNLVIAVISYRLHDVVVSCFGREFPDLRVLLFQHLVVVRRFWIWSQNWLHDILAPRVRGVNNEGTHFHICLQDLEGVKMKHMGYLLNEAKVVVDFFTIANSSSYAVIPWNENAKPYVAWIIAKS